MATIGIGIIGTGFAKHSYLPIFQAHPGARVVALCGRSPDRTAALAREREISAAYTDYRALLKDAAVEAVYIAVPHDLHHAIVSAAVGSGRHVLCEKPLALNLDQALSLCDQAQAAGVTHQVAFLHRELPANRELARLLKAGRLGALRHALFYSLQSVAAIPNAPFTWRDQAARTGVGGALGDTGAHLIDLLQSLVGRIQRVCGTSRRFVVCHQDSVTGQAMSGDAPDAVSFVAEVAGGGQCLMQVSFAATGCGLDQILTLSGSEGSLSTELHTEPPRGMRWHQLFATEPGKTGLRPSALVEDPAPNATSPMDGMRTDFQAAMSRVADGFLRAIAEGSSLAPTFHDGAQCQAVVEAVMQSANSGEWAAVRQIAG